jgi:hypothetical protein
MQSALLDDFFVDLCLRFGSVGIIFLLIFFFLVEARKVQILMCLQELVILSIRPEVHIIELLQFIDILSLVGHPLSERFIINQCKFRCSL